LTEHFSFVVGSTGVCLEGIPVGSWCRSRGLGDVVPGVPFPVPGVCGVPFPVSGLLSSSSVSLFFQPFGLREMPPVVFLLLYEGFFFMMVVVGVV
jgi:hypothetical protein